MPIKPETVPHDLDLTVKLPNGKSYTYTVDWSTIEKFGKDCILEFHDIAVERAQKQKCNCYIGKFCKEHQGGCGRHNNLEPDSHCTCNIPKDAK
jgi:hypothetical protein